VVTIQRDISRQAEILRTTDDPHESLLSGRQPYFSQMALDPVPLSPRQVPQDERRPSMQAYPQRPSIFRPPAPPHLNISPRRYGSIGGANSNISPASYQHRPSIVQQPLPQPQQHPLASVQSPGSISVSSPNLARRHTSADIRATDGWPPQVPQIPAGLAVGGTASPYESQSPGNWPASPNRTPNASDQHIRDSLASYELGAPRRQNGSPSGNNDSLPPDRTSGQQENGGWNPNFSGAFSGPPPVTGGLQKAARMLDSAPPTRRSSMASNVHSLLNPAETAERDEEDEGPGGKRKRVG
jgi:hypothetical protein